MIRRMLVAAAAAAVLVLAVVVVMRRTSREPGPPSADAPVAAPAAEAAFVLPPRVRQRLDWERRTTLGAYDEAGHRDAKWDEAAREALTHHTNKSFEWIGRTGDEEDRIWSAGHAAIRASCRDGLVLYAVARGLTLRGADDRALAEAHQQAADAIRGSKYPAYRKAVALLRAVTYTAAAGQAAAAQKARGYADEALALMPEVFADKDLPVACLAELFDILMQAKEAYGGDAQALGEKALAALEASPQPPGFVLTGKGMYYVHFAWAARGGGWARSVTDEGWELFSERIGVARKRFEEAWALDNSNADAAAEMITVEMAAGGDREAMERWYGRAMAAAPSCREAAARKMTFLEPKWHGDPEAMLGFGRELLAGGN